MASVDKHSLREEFEQLKGRFEHLSAQGQLSAEARTLFESLLVLFQVLMAVFLEKHTRKDSRNSSLPPSQTEPGDDTASRPSQSPGKKHTHTRSANTRTIETVETAAVDACATCGEDLRDAPCQDTERRTRIDIVFEKELTHVDAEIKDCPRCQHRNRASFPGDLGAPLQYGPGIRAYALNLLITQMLSLKRVQQSLHSLIDTSLSQATLLQFVLRLHQALADWEAHAIEHLLSHPAIHVDETSLRVDKRRHWIHVYSAGTITLKRLHRKRGREAIDDIGLIPRYDGVLIHDCWASYLAYERCGHALCGSHLLRELTFIVDAHGYRWARHMKRLLQHTAAAVAEREHKTLTESEYRKLTTRYRSILTRGKKELPPIARRQHGQRGRIAKSDAHNLWERLQRYEHAVLCFAETPEVAFTNNRAERDLRMSKVKQKVSGCFRTETYAHAYCRISSYLQTMANRGYNPIVAIQIALARQLPFEGGE